MDRTYSVRCPNCGNLATRSYFNSKELKYIQCHGNRVSQIECPHCDYLMVTCLLNGSVIEAHCSSTSGMTNATLPGNIALTNSQATFNNKLFA